MRVLLKNRLRKTMVTEVSDRVTVRERERERERDPDMEIAVNPLSWGLNPKVYA